MIHSTYSNISNYAPIEITSYFSFSVSYCLQAPLYPTNAKIYETKVFYPKVANSYPHHLRLFHSHRYCIYLTFISQKAISRYLITLLPLLLSTLQSLRSAASIVPISYFYTDPHPPTIYQIHPHLDPLEICIYSRCLDLCHLPYNNRYNFGFQAYSFQGYGF